MTTRRVDYTVNPNGGRSMHAAVPAAARPKPAQSADFLMWTLFAAVLCYVWRVQDIMPVLATIQLPLMLTVLAILLYAADTDRRRKLALLRHPISTLICVIFVLGLLSVPTSLYQSYSLSSLINDLFRNILLMAMIAASVRSVKDVERYALALVAGGAFFAQYIFFNMSVGMSGRLGHLVYYDANDLGMLLVSTIPISLFFVLRGRNLLLRLLALGALGLFVVVFLKTGSRGGFLGLIAVGAYLLFKLKAISKFTRIAVVTSVVVIMALVATDEYWNMMRSLLNVRQDYNWSGQEATGRMEIWKRGIGYMLDRPLTGVGFTAFPTAEGTLAPQAALQQYGIGFKWSAAHNSFIQIGAELGVFGLVAFTALLWIAFRTARAIGSRRLPDGSIPDVAVLGEVLAGAVVGYAVCAFFLSQAYAAFAILVFALIVALHKACLITGERAAVSGAVGSHANGPHVQPGARAAARAMRPPGRIRRRA